jgi:hypothetical protein
MFVGIRTALNLIIVLQTPADRVAVQIMGVDVASLVQSIVFGTLCGGIILKFSILLHTKLFIPVQIHVRFV